MVWLLYSEFIIGVNDEDLYFVKKIFVSLEIG